MEKPVIVTNYGGHLDFSLERFSFLVEVEEMIDLKGMGRVHRNKFGEIPKWAEVSIDDLRKKMRFVFENQDKAKEFAKMGREYVNLHYSQEKIQYLLQNEFKRVRKMLKEKNTPFATADGKIIRDEL